LLNEVGVEDAAIERRAETSDGAGCDCSRTRTTSSGVTRGNSFSDVLSEDPMTFGDIDERQNSNLRER